MRHAARLLLLLSAALTLAACGNLPERDGGEPRVVVPESTQGGIPFNQQKDYAPVPGEIPANVAQTPDAVPKAEPRSASGNAPTYEVLGKTYHVMDDAHGYHEQGYASWYGKKFQGRKTASGETYDIFGMTAAHRTLPLPTYVRVTNLGNGRTCVVKVNDRGPFHSQRIIDLSYAAAAKLGLIGHGTAKVQIDALEPGGPPPPAPPAAVASASMSPLPDNPAPAQAAGWLQVGAYLDPVNAATMRDTLTGRGLTRVEIRTRDNEDPPLHHVLVGPYPNEASAREMRTRLAVEGFKPQWVGN